MKSAYIVTLEHNYFGYPIQGIIGVFTKKESAQKFVDSFDNSGPQTVQIEEFIINPFMYELNQGYKCYFLRMKKSGEIPEIELSDGPPITCSCIEPWFRKFAYDGNRNLLCHTYARNENHAIRICDKERLKIIAQGKWPEDLTTI